MNQIVECVPNFSEGRDNNIIDAIAGSIDGVEKVKLLSVEPDKDYNRTVITFVGEPEAVKEAAFQATKTATELIDMKKHEGEHPRIGAVDVVPFIPVSGVDMKDCVTLARAYGERVAKELNVPIYLYEEAAVKSDRKNLATVRKGEYEGLSEKLKDPNWIPDFPIAGDDQYNPKSGATVTGARFFLIAYNVNLKTGDKNIAHEIALRIRESGRPKKNEKGEVVKDDNGKTINIPGSLKSVKAMGVLLERFNIAQVSINLTNFNTTPPHIAFEEVKKEAAKLGVEVTGSEIVGLIPRDALLAAGKYYLGDHVKNMNLSEMDLIHIAVQYLGLSQFEVFNPNKKIIEYMI
jgi:glutamate formiminotransferase / formiminotetrahydrofolate cyclodeaminase